MSIYISKDDLRKKLGQSLIKVTQDIMNLPVDNSIKFIYHKISLKFVQYFLESLGVDEQEIVDSVCKDAHYG